MRNVLIIFLASFLLTGCFTEKNIKVGNVEGIKVNKFKNNKLSVDILLPIENPNFFRFKISEINLKVSLKGKELGEITNVDNLIIPSRSNLTHTFSIDLEFSNVLLGTVAFINSLSGNKIKVELDGYIEVKSFLFKRKIYIKEDKLVGTV
jgi:LEA14-like dessication related protein